MGVLDRLFSSSKDRRAKAARAREADGDWSGAVEAWLEAGCAGEAARVLVLRADAEPDPGRKLAFLGKAAELAPDGSQEKVEARRRRALCALDLARGSAGGQLPSELARIAVELADLGEHERAAEAYALAGDRDAQAGELEKAGAIERLEEVLEVEQSEERARRDRERVSSRIDDLVATGHRREALSAAESWLASHPGDEPIALASRRIRDGRIAAPRVRVRLHAQPIDLVLGDEIVIGRSEASIVVPSPAISRRHLRIAREAGVILVEDLGGKNGTRMGGARLAGKLPVGSGLELSLGGEVPCSISPHPEGGAALDLAGDRHRLPLGPAHVGPFALDLAPDGWVVVRPYRAGGAMFLGSLACDGAIELLAGDRVREVRDGPVVLEVPA